MTLASGPPNTPGNTGTPQTRTFTPRRHEGPRKVRGGIKLQGTLQRGSDASAADAAVSLDSGQSLAQQYLSVIEGAIDPSHHAPGLEYAKSGQIVNVQFVAGAIAGPVQGSAARPYAARIGIAPFSDEQWQRVIATMSEEAMHAAKILAGQWPASLDEQLRALGLSVSPVAAQEIVFSCSCNHGDVAARGCKHIMALALIATEQLATNPLHAFTVRGRTPEELLDAVRRARMQHAPSATQRAAESIVPDSQTTVPLEATLDDFWRTPVKPAEWEQLQQPLNIGHTPHALLRRLGPSPMNGRFPLVGLLASVYDSVAESVKKLRE